jgi:hypothetical protein
MKREEKVIEIETLVCQTIVMMCTLQEKVFLILSPFLQKMIEYCRKIHFLGN